MHIFKHIHNFPEILICHCVIVNRMKCQAKYISYEMQAPIYIAIVVVYLTTYDYYAFTVDLSGTV